MIYEDESKDTLIAQLKERDRVILETPLEASRAVDLYLSAINKNAIHESLWKECIINAKS